MNNKLHIAYATRCGSTAEVAQAIGKVFCDHGGSVDVRPAKEVTGIPGYQAVILGSAVRYGAFLPAAVKFLEQNRAAAGQKPRALFACHIINLGDDETSRNQRLAYLDAVRKLAAPQAEAFFAGNADMSKVSFFERMIGRAVKTPEGDFRDWNVIRSWAETLYQSGFAA